jgi:hypothetical protein
MGEHAKDAAAPADSVLLKDPDFSVSGSAAEVAPLRSRLLRRAGKRKRFTFVVFFP